MFPDSVEIVEVPTLFNLPLVGQLILRSYLRVLNHWFFSFNVWLYLVLHPPRANEVYIALGSLYEALPLRWYKKIHRRFSYLCSVRGKHAAEASHDYPLLRNVFYRWEQLNLRSASALLANGQDTMDYLASLGHSSYLMKNGVDWQNFSKDEHHYTRPAFMPEGMRHVVMVANLRKIRGLETAIQAMKYLKDQIKDLRLVFVGAGKPTLWQELARKLDVSDTVVFAGQRSDVADILHFASIVLTLCDSRYGSGLSMSLLEAMASGKPIIAWDNEIYRQVLSHEKNALLVPEKDPQALAASIVRVCSDPGLATRIGATARQDARAYDWSVVVSEFKAILERTRKAVCK
jgi:glycosyltransferase involved in cell wall biosynthesis